MVRKVILNVLYTIFVLGFLWISGQLFFEQQADKFMVYAKERFFTETKEEGPKITHLKVVYPDEPISLEPTLADPVTRQRLVNIYEPLVGTDRDLQIKPSLALSFGLIDETTWEFRLRRDVMFHDGSNFDVEDVVISIERAKNYPGSELKDILKSIDRIEPIDGYSFRIKTFKPDPLLLQRLSLVMIIPSETEGEDDFLPVGTGSYAFQSWKKNEGMELVRFDEYWGSHAKFEQVSLMTKSNKFERVQVFVDKEADVLAFVPFDAADFVEQQGFSMAAIPSLEVQFLMHNFDSDLMSELKARRAVSLAIDIESLVNSLGKFAKPVNQFVSNGVFGFNQNLAEHEFDLEKAEILADEAGLKGQTLQFHLVKGLDVLGEHVRIQLNKIGVNVIVSYLELDKLWESITNGDADMYFFGFKSDIGDAADFMDVIVHGEGSFNVANYDVDSVDQLIDESLVEMDEVKRLEILHRVMKIIVEEDVLGVPLFEYETLSAFSDDLELKPRIDGFLYFDELSLK